MFTSIHNWMFLLSISATVVKLQSTELKLQNTELRHFKNYQKYDNNVCSEVHLNRIASLLYTSDWWNLFIIYNGNDETTVTGILRKLENTDRYILATTVDIGNMNSTKTREVLANIYSSTTNSIRILFVLNNQTIPFLKMANKFEENKNKNKTRNNVHNSKCSSWIIVMTTQQDIDLGFVVNVNSIARIRCNEFSELSERKGETLGLQRKECLNKNMFSDSNFKLTGRHFLIGTITSQNFKNIVQKLTATLSQALNFSYTYKQPDDQYYGSNIDGRWNGLIGQLLDQEVDMVIAELTMTHERMKVVDFVLPGFLSHGIGVLYKRGTAVESAWFKVFKPLQFKVYVCVFIALIYVGLILTVLNNGHNGFFFNVWEFFKTLSLLIGFLSVRGNGIWPKTDSSRVFVIVLWMCCVVIAATYIGNLTAKITETREKIPFNNLAELARLSDWKICFRGESLVQNIFQNSKDSDMIDIWNRVVSINKSDPLVLHPRGKFHMNRLLAPDSKYAYIEFDAKYYVKKRNDCSLAAVDTDVLSNLNIAIAVPKNSSLKLPLEKMMIKLADIGFFDILNDIRYKDNRPGSCKVTVKNRTLVFDDVKGVVLIVVFGLSLALIILLTENIYKYLKHQLSC